MRATLSETKAPLGQGEHRARASHVIREPFPPTRLWVRRQDHHRFRTSAQIVHNGRRAKSANQQTSSTTQNSPTACPTGSGHPVVHHSLMQRDLIVAARVLTTPKYELRGFPDLRFAFPLAGQTVIGQDDIMHEFKIAVARSGEDRGSQSSAVLSWFFMSVTQSLGLPAPALGAGR
jgi:hypothetical protein